MKSPTNILIALLAASVLAVGLLAWSQYRELILLRAQLAGNESATLSKQLADARKTIKTLEDRISALRGRGFRDGEGASDGAGPGGNGGPRPGGRFGAFAALSNNPEFQKLMAIEQKARISQTYGPLFKALNLSPEQLAQFQSLLADKQQAMMDVLQAAREQGINPRTDPDGFKTLVSQAVAQTDQSIQQVLGDAGFQQYQQFQQTLPERNTVNSLQQQLSYTQTPLTDDQASQLISLLAQTQPQRAGNGTAGTETVGGTGGIMSMLNGGGTARVTDDTLTQAQSLLSAPQVAVLQQLQQQQQAQQQIQQLMRSANQGNGQGSPSQGTPSAPGASTVTGGKG